MLDEYQTLTELRRQLDVVRRRIDQTMARLAEARPVITADGLECVAVAAWAEGRGDLFQLCVRLEVALAESNESANSLVRRLRELAAYGPAGGVDGSRLYGHSWGEQRGSSN